ncbi:putative folate-biopterin transporter 2 [Wolffia australiana]
MGSPPFARISSEKSGMEEGETSPLTEDPVRETEKSEIKNHASLSSPLRWIKMLAEEMHWSSVMGVLIVYGISQGVGGGLGRVAIDYYWKDVQKIQPSESQVYQGITYIPWMVKPVWGLLTDLVPVAGYRRRPYLIFAGILGIIPMLIISLQKGLPVLLALLALTTGSGGVAIADVTIDAVVASKCITHPSLASDMQSLCGMSSSIGRLLGSLVSGLLVHWFGSRGALGLLSLPAALVLMVGTVLKEPPTRNVCHKEVSRRFLDAGKNMGKTLRCPAVWRPCIYMYLSLALSVMIHEGMFYWITDAPNGPKFSQETVGMIMAGGSVGSLMGVLLYQSVLKDYSFRTLLFSSQLLYGIAGFLDLALVMRLNLRLGVPDFFFAVVDETVSQMIGRIKWMPLLVLSSKLCPPGIEGTFFALLMSIDNIGLLSASWGGGLLLHLLHVTRTQFDNLGAAIVIRSLLRILPLLFLFLIPATDPNSALLPEDMLGENDDPGQLEEVHGRNQVELASLVQRHQ